MRRYGRCCRTRARARMRLDSTLKSHGAPSSGSLTVRSNANPGRICFMWLLRMSSVILGGE